MSHPTDKTYLYVVASEQDGPSGKHYELCFTDQGNPAVYRDSCHAEAHAVKLRGPTLLWPVRVLQCPVM